MGLDHFIDGNFKINTFNKFFGMNNKINEIMETKTTLDTYKTFCVSREGWGAQQHLKNIEDVIKT